MKTKFLAASALLLMTSGAALALPVSVHNAVGDSIGKTVSVKVSNVQLAGDGGDGGLGGTANISAVPLPAAGWMLLAGLGGIAVMRRRAKA
jgi:hypothetical protein